MIQTLATDLDGTLFYPKRVFRILTSKNRKFLIRFLNSGRKLILVSGRNYPIAKKIEKKLNHPVSMIACNGAVLYQDGEVVEEHYLSKEEVRNLYETTKKDKKLKIWLFMTNTQPLIITMRKINPIFRFIATLIMKMQFQYSERYVIGDKQLEKYLNDEDCHFYKVMPCYGFTKKAHERARAQTEEYTKTLGDSYEVLWSSNSIEFMKKDVNKANALKKLLTMLKLEETETAVVGDSGNDLPLFAAFDQSYCMENAPKEVKENAKATIKAVSDLEDKIFPKKGDQK